MRFDQYTQKAQAAVIESQSLAEQHHHAAIEPEHLLEALLKQEGGVVPAIIARIGVDPALLTQSLERALNSMTPATGPELRLVSAL